MDSLTRTELSGREVGKAFLGRGFLKRPPGMKMGGVPDPTRVQHTEHKGKLLSTEFKVEHSPVLAEMVECRTSAASNFVFEGEVGIESKRLLSVPPHSCPLSSPVIENESSEPLLIGEGSSEKICPLQASLHVTHCASRLLWGTTRVRVGPATGVDTQMLLCDKWCQHLRRDFA
jgi:hypothetical protein